MHTAAHRLRWASAIERLVPLIRLNRRKGAFTLVEVMISIAVISIGMLGALSAIAFGLRASDRGSKGTFALNANQRILEMMLNSFPAPGPVSTNGSLNAGPGKLFPDADPLGVFDQPATSPLWHPLYAAPPGNPFLLRHFVPDSRPVDQVGFAANATQYQCNINVKYAPFVAGVPSARSNMVVYTVTTRWRDKGYWRSIGTMAYASGTKS